MPWGHQRPNDRFIGSNIQYRWVILSERRISSLFACPMPWDFLRFVSFVDYQHQSDTHCHNQYKSSAFCTISRSLSSIFYLFFILI